MNKACSTCGKDYPDTLENFPRNRRQCRSCRTACTKRYSEEHREQIRASDKRYRAEHREEIRARQKKRREEHGDHYPGYQKEYRKKLRLEVLGYYAPDGLRCACCGEDHVEFLCLDHINGNGRKHRASIKGSLYHWLKREGFPDGFRVLCLNCNGSLGHYGYCPHGS